MAAAEVEGATFAEDGADGGGEFGAAVLAGGSAPADGSKGAESGGIFAVVG
jgi:hypothetical protein